MWFGTFTHICTAPRGMVAGTYNIQGRQPLPWGMYLVSFEQISQPSFLSWLLLMWFGTFTHTCTAPQRMVAGTCNLQEREPLPWIRSPVSFEQISQPSFFSLRLLVRFATFTCTCTAPQGIVEGTCHLQGMQPLPWGRSPVSFEQIRQPSFFSRMLLMWFGTFTRTCTAPLGMVVGTCHL